MNRQASWFFCRLWPLCAWLASLLGAAAIVPADAGPVLERVTTIAPFPRGLVMLDGELYVLCRGRVRDAGGVTAEVNDQAGAIYAVNPSIAEPADSPEVSEAVRNNGRVVTLPIEPPFKLWNRNADPPESDRATDRPYCTLRYHEPTKSFYLCAFSGIDKAPKPDGSSFSKNLTDALFRYDLRTKKWYEVERHNIEAGGNYPHHDPKHRPPPHGWLNGPDNCLALGDWLYAVSKDNSRLVRYDLRAIAADPEAGPPPSECVMGEEVFVKGLGLQRFYGQSALAYRDGWLYVGYRTSSVILRFRLDKDHLPVRPIRAELLARFDPYDPQTKTSANLTDIGFDDRGRLYVISAMPGKLYRFTPDPKKAFDARDGRVAPWADLAALSGRAGLKSENVLCHGDYVYVTTGDGYGYQQGADGTVYRLRIGD